MFSQPLTAFSVSAYSYVNTLAVAPLPLGAASENQVAVSAIRQYVLTSGSSGPGCEPCEIDGAFAEIPTANETQPIRKFLRPIMQCSRHAVLSKRLVLEGFEMLVNRNRWLISERTYDPVPNCSDQRLDVGRGTWVRYLKSVRSAWDESLA